MSFKSIFISHIMNVENYTIGKGDRKTFDVGLDFLSKYTVVSYKEITNYSNQYTNFNTYKKDKDNWLKWYEENKCNNIQIKK